MTEILTTARLRLREITPADSVFLLALLNEPDFIRNIGDRQVRTLDEAHQYLVQHLLGSYQRHGFGLWLVERQVDSVALGLCGLVQRDYLDCPDVGYALLARFAGQGYASEAAVAVAQYGRTVLRLPKLAGIVSPHNLASKKILQKAGLQPVGQRQVPATGDWVDYFESV